MADVPYSNASSGTQAREEITRLLRKMGCESVGFMDEFATGTLVLAFVHNGQPVQLRASGKGWAAWFLRENPHTHGMRKSRSEYETAAQAQGMIAVNSILRDWVKGSIVAVQCGLMPVEAMFMAHMVTNDGRTLLERIGETRLLSAPEKKDGK